MNSAVGATHFIAAKMDGRFTVDAGCFSRRKDFNVATAAKWGVDVTRTYDNWELLLKNERSRIDAIVVLTPTPAHTDVVTEALKGGYTVICEKSLTVSSAEALDIQRVVKSHVGVVYVTYNYTGYTMVRELREMIRAGRLGKIHQVHIEMPQEGFARVASDGSPIKPQGWRLKDAPVSSLSLDLGSHVFQMIEFLTGSKPRSVIAIQNNFGVFKGIIDNTAALLHYSDDMVCNIWFSKVAAGYRNGLRVRVFGDLGSAQWYQMEPETLNFSDNRGNHLVLDRASGGMIIAGEARYNRFKAGHPTGFHEAFANLYEDIAEAITHPADATSTSQQYVFSAETAYENLLTLEALNESAQIMKWVNIPIEKND